MRITINVPDALGAKIKKAARGTSVSAYLAGLAEEQLTNAELDRLWEEFYASVAPGPRAVRRAEALMKRLRKPTRRKRAA